MLSRRLLRIKVLKALYAHFKSESDSIATSEKNLTAAIDKTYDLYHQMLRLVVDVARYAEDRIELNRQKKLPTREDLYPNMRFVENSAIRQIADSRALNKYLDKHSLGWSRYPELIKSLYNELTASKFYRFYMSAPSTDHRHGTRMVEQFYTEIAAESELLEEVVEEQSILWADDTDFALIMVIRTLNAMRAYQLDLPLHQKYKSDEDECFAQELFLKTVLNYKEYIPYVEKFTQNWDVERIAFIDHLILVSAIAEMINFPSIPVKVTLDEYIELAKYYSTPGSSHFINGVLDKITEALVAEGLVTKTGRGLMD